MINRKLKGNNGEEIAKNFLKRQGYRIVERNFTTDLGEIDLIVTDEHMLVFVEVKARKDVQFGYAAEAVDHRKIEKINRVAAQYIKQFRLFHMPVRFDVVEVYLDEKQVNHIINAFDSYLRY